MRKADYEKQNPNLEGFFEEILQQNFNHLNNFLKTLLFELLKGKTIEIQIRGYASPLHTPEYNLNLSQRRISCLMNYFKQFKNGILTGYIESRNLIITQLPFGESNASGEISDDINDKAGSVYSTEALLERKIKIVNVILQ
tara:strand:- start:887 stop:1309 length:423 start_codon:yes stop_codon:yes gene_type:complete